MEQSGIELEAVEAAEATSGEQLQERRRKKGTRGKSLLLLLIPAGVALWIVLNNNEGAASRVEREPCFKPFSWTTLVTRPDQTGEQLKRLLCKKVFPY